MSTLTAQMAQALVGLKRIAVELPPIALSFGPAASRDVSFGQHYGALLQAGYSVLAINDPRSPAAAFSSRSENPTVRRRASLEPTRVELRCFDVSKTETYGRLLS